MSTVTRTITFHPAATPPTITGAGYSDLLIVSYGYKDRHNQKPFCGVLVRYWPDRGGWMFNDNQTFDGWGYEVISWAYMPDVPGLKEFETTEE